MLVNKLILWFILIAPWLTLFFLKKEVVKRFMPVSLLASFIMLVYNLVAENQNHWIINVSIIPSLEPAFVSGVFGAFPVITLWIFRFTFGHFWRYAVTNIIADFMFAFFPIHYVLQDVLGIYNLINITPFGRFILFITFAMILYGFQVWLEKGDDPLPRKIQ
ncbi:hypothetical protein [Bacillus sp. Marseille-Q1617]|uniref:hypothetical protein n=1 Tax=Bacillus sp. Marseille-Q1617 TaxID=2736887 RepID=UPI0020CA9AD7|nr:hypothetical protein [Bacillus sp. Marseille-Q1617]